MSFKRYPWLNACAAGCTILLILSSGCSRPREPIHHSHTNVLVITCCTLRADHLGCYGYDRKVSPNIDQLAADGFRFERALAQAPWTKAGVSAIITGMYPRSLNIEDPQHHENYRKLDDKFTTMAEIMKKLGYHTIGITANPNTSAIFNMDQGYDYYRDPAILWQFGYKKDGVWTSRDVNDLFFEHLDSLKKKDKFFAHLVVIDVHTPREHKLDPDGDDQFTLPPRAQRTLADTYDLHVSYLDESIGQLRAGLKERGLDADTLIMLNADHGEGLKDHAFYDEGHSHFMYNSTIWVPWIMYHPALKPTAMTGGSMVRQIDMLPTLMEALGANPTEYAGDACSLEGVSRWPTVVRGQPTTPVEYGIVRTQFLGSDRAAVVSDEYKLIINFDYKKKVKWRLDKATKEHHYPPLYELYRWRTDKLEKENLYANSPEVVEDLKQVFRAWEEEFPECVDASAIQLTPSQAKAETDLERKTVSDLAALGYAGDDDDDDAGDENKNTADANVSDDDDAQD